MGLPLFAFFAPHTLYTNARDCAMISVKPGSSFPPGHKIEVFVQMSDILDTLRQEGVDPALLTAVQEYRAAHPLSEVLRPRIPAPAFTYYGKEVWEQALAAILCGENLLLAGGKATGKNVLAENLAAAFGRPAWDISFHVNMDAASLIGMDTFAGGQVVFRPGPVYRCAQCGGFGVLDEINMAKNEALAVLHAVLDFRRAIDVPGYDRIPLAEETRFIATMNYGYAGTRELNEALTSRFAVVQMPTITQDNLEKLLRAQFPDLSAKYVHQFALLFLDLQKKVRQCRDFHQSAGSARYAGRAAADSAGASRPGRRWIWASPTRPLTPTSRG